MVSAVPKMGFYQSGRGLGKLPWCPSSGSITAYKLFSDYLLPALRQSAYC